MSLFRARRRTRPVCFGRRCTAKIRRFVLIPKHMFWAEHESTEPVRAVPLGAARKRQTGSDVTLIAWGNTVEKSLEAIEKIGDEMSIELIDLRSIAPWDTAMIEESVRKTGRVVVVQEDTENCSVGQMIISHLAAQAGHLERNG